MFPSAARLASRFALVALLAGATLTACQDPFAAAQDLDTVEAYEKFLAENPSSPFRTQAEIRLQELSLDQARELKTLEAYDAFLTKYPTSPHFEKATEERREFLWGWADTEDTAEAWQKFLDEYPTGNKKLAQEARKRLKMAQNKDKVSVGPVEFEQVNLAENPDGPLDGWGFYADVGVSGTQEVSYLMMRLSFLGTDGQVIDSVEWPAVAPHLPGRLPVEEEFKVPMKPGESRTFEYTTGDLPAGWSKKATVSPVAIKFVGEDD